MQRAEDTAQRYRHLATALSRGTAVEVPLWTPEREIRRSPAAARVGRLAHASGLFCFHFEHRVHLPLPEAWVPAHDPSLADPPSWDAGVLAERKYQSFRHDLAIGSFHPHHRAKWSTHELCHGLVGFAWRPDATPFFHACAGRLAELLPVALWYGLDEAFLTRCPRHQGDGALFRTFCPDCEAVAAARPDDPEPEAPIAWALHFVDRELAALARSRRLGRPLPHRFATLDLCSDGVAYARAHGERLASPTFGAWMERFAVRGGGWSEDLDGLEARVLDVLGGLLGEADPAPLAPTASQGRWRWTLQDLGWRILQVAADADTETSRALYALTEPLAEALQRSATEVEALAAIEDVHAAYDALHAEVHLPHPDDVFGLGYPVGEGPVPGASEQLGEGLTTCCVLSSTAISDLPADERSAILEDFAADDAPRRAHLAERWADWLAERHGPVLAALARWEALVATLPKRAPDHLGGPGLGDRWCLSEAARAHVFAHEILAVAERVDDGSLVARIDDARVVIAAVEGEEVSETPQALVLARDARGELLVLEVDPDTVSRLLAGAVSADVFEEDELATLVGLRVLRPEAWALSRA